MRRVHVGQGDQKKQAMDDRTPERLREFRARYQQEAGGPGRAVALNVAVLVAGIAIGLTGLLLLREGALPPANAPHGGLSPDQARQLALYLEGKDLLPEAIGAYEEYLDKGLLDDASRAKVCYSVARLASKTGDYNRALAYLYQAEMLDPQTELREEIDKEIVACLEKIGRTASLRRELRKRTHIERTPEDLAEDEAILAEFGGEIITDRDLERELDKLPAPLRDSLRTPEQQAQFLENMVAERLLLGKAVRLGLDQDPEIEESLAAQRDAMIVRKLIADEVRDKVSITPEDVERFYRAESSRFAEPAQAEVVVARIDVPEAASETVDFSQEPVKVFEGQPIPGVPESAEAVPVILAAEPGTVTEAIRLGQEWYRFKVLGKAPARVRPFEQVKDHAERLLRLEKEQEQFRLLIEETLRAQDVRLYPERLAKPEAEG